MSLNYYNRNTDRVNFSIISTEAERAVLSFERSTGKKFEPNLFFIDFFI